MSRSSSSDTKTELYLQLELISRKPPPCIRQLVKVLIIQNLVAFMTLALLVLGLIGCGPLTVFEPAPQPKERKNLAQLPRYMPNDLYIRYTQPGFAPDPIGVSFVTEPLPYPGEAMLTPQPPPEPTFTPEPRLIAFRPIVDVPPPPYSLPTSRPRPTAIIKPTRTAMPTPFPTPVSLPTVAPILTPVVELQPEIEHVVIISIDGLRPDALVEAEAPTLHKLIAEGTFFPHAQTIKTSITLPSHASMLSGMIEEKHGVLWNAPYIGWPGMAGPTLFNVAHDAGLSTAMVFGKEKLNYLVLGDSVDKLFGTDAHDPEVKDQAIQFIQEGLTDILFIHFPDVDRVGHEYGWMSSNQFYAITFVDGLIGEIVAELDNEGYLPSTLLIVTADHGGHDFNHGDDSPLDRTIPWLAVGPGVAKGLTITRCVNIYDTATTVLYAWDLPIPEKWEGKPVLEIFPQVR